MFIHLDIETVPSQDPEIKAALAADIAPPGNYKSAEAIGKWEQEVKPGLIEEAYRKTSFDGTLGQIAVAAIAIDDETPVTFWRPDWRDAEHYILSSLFGAIEGFTERHLGGGTRGHIKPVFVGHYIADFDLRFIFQRAVMLGIRPPACIPFKAKPWDEAIFDTMTMWAGVKGRISLDKLCRALGVATKGSEIGEEIDGSMVWDFVQAGRIADVAAYCAGDVERVRAVRKRLMFQDAA